jgi:hypothetical protein
VTRLIGVALVAALVCGTARADDKDAAAIIDKAIKALGGEEKLAKLKAFTWSGKGTITLMDADNPITSSLWIDGLDRYRQEFEGEFGENKITGVTVVAGDKGWQKFAGNTMEMDKDALANARRVTYLTVTPVTVLPLKGKGFKLSSADEIKVGDRPVVGVKVTGPDDKDFTIYFDKETGLPARVVAKVVGFMGDEYTQETTYSEFKEMAGIQKATKVSAKRDGSKFVEQTVTEFKALEKVDPKLFAEP